MFSINFLIKSTLGRYYTKYNSISQSFVSLYLYIANIVKILIYYNNNQQITNDRYIYRLLAVLISYLVGISETIRVITLDIILKKSTNSGILFKKNFKDLDIFILKNKSIEDKSDIKKEKLKLISGVEDSKVAPKGQSTNESKNNNDLNKSKKLLKESKDIKFSQWLAGLIDGDGCLGVTQSKYTNCEITVELKDQKALYYVKQRLGGSVKLRSGSCSIRYRITNKKIMINLINIINGYIVNSVRLPQLHRACSILDIPLKTPVKLDINSAWFSGFFDADGCITYSFKRGIPQLTISASNKSHIDVSYFKEIFGGNIYYDKGGYGSYKWSIQKKEDILYFVNYIKNNPCRTTKFNKIMLCEKYYELKDMKAYKYDNTLKYKAWLDFEKKWRKSD